MEYDIVVDTDSYKLSHWKQYPNKTTQVTSYLEARPGGLHDQVVWFGARQILEGLYVNPGSIDFMAGWTEQHMGPDIFNKDGWDKLFKKYNGELPLQIAMLPEGSIVDCGTPLMIVRNTDPEFYWLPSWVETVLMRTWYPSTVATISNYVRRMLLKHAAIDGTAPEAVDFKLHDFGARGVSSQESAIMGGMAHLLNFNGTDTVVGAMGAIDTYEAEMPVGYSIPAAEHSTITSFGEDGEAAAYVQMLSRFSKSPLVAVVSDSFDYRNAVENLWGDALRDQVVGFGGTLVVRPDSGDPLEIVMWTLAKLEEKFGITRNEKGFKVLNNVRIIQGDGIGPSDIERIISSMKEAGYALENVAFGMGGGLLQKVNRDTLRFAYKNCEIIVDGETRQVRKTTLTDPTKGSKTFKEIQSAGYLKNMKIVYNNGLQGQALDKWEDIVARVRGYTNGVV